jgi:hypothetical protein
LHHQVRHIEGIDKKLTRTAVTRQLLWGEIKIKHPYGYSYSQYCGHLKRFLSKKDVVMNLQYNHREKPD